MGAEGDDDDGDEEAGGDAADVAFAAFADPAELEAQRHAEQDGQRRHQQQAAEQLVERQVAAAQVDFAATAGLPAEHGVDDEGQREQRQQAAGDGEQQRQRGVAARQVGEEGRTDAARAGGDDHQAEQHGRREAEADPDQRGDQRHEHDLAEHADDDAAPVAERAAEVVHTQRQAEREHDEGERQGQEEVFDHGQRPIIRGARRPGSLQQRVRRGSEVGAGEQAHLA